MIPRIFLFVAIAKIMAIRIMENDDCPLNTDPKTTNASIFYFYGNKFITKASYIKLIPNDEEAKKAFGLYYFLNVHIELNKATIVQLNVTKFAAFTDQGKRPGKRMFDWCDQTFYIDNGQRVRMRNLPDVKKDEKEWNFLLTNLTAPNRIDGAYEPKEIVGHTIVLSHFNKLIGCVVVMPSGLEYFRATFSARMATGIIGSITFLNFKMTHRRKSERKMFTRILVELNWTGKKTNGEYLQWFLSSEMCGTNNISPKTSSFPFQIPSQNIFDINGHFLFRHQIHKHFCFTFVSDENIEESKEGNDIRCIPINKILI